MGLPVPAKLDLSAYRTDDLVANVAGLISIPTALRKILSTVAIVVPVAVVGMFGLLAVRGAGTPFVWAGGLFYAFCAGLFLAVTGGLLRVMYHAVGCSHEILSVLTGITRRVAHDRAALQSGGSQLPESGELLRQVYMGVLVPTVDKTARKTLGFLAPPVVGVLRTVVGPAVRGLAQLVATQAVARRIGGLVPDPTVAATTVSGWSQRIDATMAVAEDVSGTVSGRLWWFVLLPATVLYVMAVLLVMTPLAVAVVMGWL